jgi:hypothetical protein
MKKLLLTLCALGMVQQTFTGQLTRPLMNEPYKAGHQLSDRLRLALGNNPYYKSSLRPETTMQPTFMGTRPAQGAYTPYGVEGMPQASYNNPSSYLPVNHEAMMEGYATRQQQMNALQMPMTMQKGTKMNNDSEGDYTAYGV